MTDDDDGEAPVATRDVAPDWDPHGPDVLADQRAAYDSARARCPVAHDAGGGHAGAVRRAHALKQGQPGKNVRIGNRHRLVMIRHAPGGRVPYEPRHTAAGDRCAIVGLRLALLAGLRGLSQDALRRTHDRRRRRRGTRGDT